VSESNSKVKVLLEREQAVIDTLSHASAEDIVLLAGKGHEDYIILPDGLGGTKKTAYDERAIVSQFYEAKSEITQ
jgi:UDP-N-acetylmuramoyl-L-alanyl-D-glutamate--2,6-diaminopimelate ligase